MPHHFPAQIVPLDSFRPSTFLLAGDRPGHPEGASTPCQCQAPEPCWSHDPDGVLGHAAGPRPAAAALVAEPVAAEPVADEVVAELEEAAALTAADTAEGWAPSRCQCIAPEPCRVHPADRPYLARPPRWNDPAPDSPVARTAARLAADRAAGVLPGAEPGQGIEVLPFLTDHELGAWTQALLAEHHRRQSRFADYRAGARQAGGAQ